MTRLPPSTLAAAALALALALAAAPSAGAAPPWRAAERMQELSFDAQTSLLLGSSSSAERTVARARTLFGGALAGRLRADAPAAHRDVLAALAAESRAARGRDEVALAAARGRLHAALMRGSYAVTLAAVASGDAGRASTWLLLREFRKATRYTRPGVDATLALKQLARGKSSRRAAALGVKKDLLDAYQARLGDSLADADDALERRFGPRWAETAAIAAGFWQILSGEYAKSRGAQARADADAAFARLERSAAAGDARAYRAARAHVDRALDGFTAAPFTREEQARRAGQLVRFVDLVPVDYDHGTDDGKVTIPFEIQESIAFREGAASAFSDLEGDLSKRNPRLTARVGRDLDKLREFTENARDGKGAVAQDTIEAVQQDAHDTLDKLIPKEWKEDDSESDFDLISLTLDRMEAAVSAGEYKQAEQARLEAYSFFEFGPELSLRSIAPDVTARVEGLVWFGADGKQGLAKLIAEHKPRRDVHETRLALDQALSDGAASLGEGASTATVVTNAAVIVFREGLEAVLIMAAVMASLTGASRGQRRPMLFGALLALCASVVTFILAQTVLTELAHYGEKLEAIVGLIAIGVLLLVLNWFFHKVYWTEHISKFHKRRRRLLAVAGGGFISAQVLGFVLLGFSTVYREGFETVLFLQALELNSGGLVVAEGVLLGGLGVAAVAVATFVLERKLPYRKMLIATGLLLTVVLMIMVGKTVRIMQGVGWVPITPIDMEVPFWTGLWLGFFPTVETIVAQVGSVLFVIGSYVVAERLKHRPRKRSATVGERSGAAQHARVQGPVRADREPGVVHVPEQAGAHRAPPDGLA